MMRKSKHPKKASPWWTQCDKCGKPNSRADECSYCPECRAQFQARIRQDPETQPVGSP